MKGIYDVSDQILLGVDEVFIAERNEVNPTFYLALLIVSYPLYGLGFLGNIMTIAVIGKKERKFAMDVVIIFQAIIDNIGLVIYILDEKFSEELEYPAGAAGCKIMKPYFPFSKGMSFWLKTVIAILRNR